MNLLGAKIYYDGGHWIAIPHTERRYKKRNSSIPLSSEEKKKVEIKYIYISIKLIICLNLACNKSQIFLFWRCFI